MITQDCIIFNYSNLMIHWAHTFGKFILTLCILINLSVFHVLKIAINWF